MKRTLRLLAPYFAVGIFWCVFSNAWLAILAYHAQILFWSRGERSRLRLRVGTQRRSAPSGIAKPGRTIFLALPAALAGPLLYVLLPYMTHTDLSVWLADYRLTGPWFLLMIPYFAFFHTTLEQISWNRLREETPLAHPFFAGYHMLVLYSLLTVPWLLVCLAVLGSASVIWQQMTKRSGSLAFAIVSHVLADLGIIIAAYLRLRQ